MKRELKPFVVEVKRGKRRQSFLGQFEDQTVTMTDATRRAELALFSGPSGGKVAAKRSSDEPAGRILPSLIEPPPTEAVAEEPAPRRRGRKPGSKNKPKVPSFAEPAPMSAMPQDDEDDFADDARADWSSDEDEDSSNDREPMPVVAHAPDAPTLPRRDESPVEPRQRLRERSTILARYVHGTAPAPGEGWTRRGRRARDGRQGKSVD